MLLKHFTNAIVGGTESVSRDAWDSTMSLLRRLDPTLPQAHEDGPKGVKRIAREIGYHPNIITKILCSVEGQAEVGRGVVLAPKRGRTPNWIGVHSGVVNVEADASFLDIPDAPAALSEDNQQLYMRRMLEFRAQTEKSRESPRKLQAIVNREAREVAIDLQQHQQRLETAETAASIADQRWQEASEVLKSVKGLTYQPEQRDAA